MIAMTSFLTFLGSSSAIGLLETSPHNRRDDVDPDTVRCEGRCDRRATTRLPAARAGPRSRTVPRGCLQPRYSGWSCGPVRGNPAKQQCRRCENRLPCSARAAATSCLRGLTSHRPGAHSRFRIGARHRSPSVRWQRGAAERDHLAYQVRCPPRHFASKDTTETPPDQADFPLITLRKLKKPCIRAGLHPGTRPMVRPQLPFMRRVALRLEVCSQRSGRNVAHGKTRQHEHRVSVAARARCRSG
jgi:hypothetical protein